MTRVTMGKSPWGSHHGVVSRNTRVRHSSNLCGVFNMTSLKGPEILDSMMLRYKEAWLNIDHEWRWLEMYFALNMRIFPVSYVYQIIFDGLHLPFLMDWGFSFIFVLQVETRMHPTYGWTLNIFWICQISIHFLWFFNMLKESLVRAFIWKDLRLNCFFSSLIVQHASTTIDCRKKCSDETHFKNWYLARGRI